MHDLRVLYPPTRIAYFALFSRDGFQRFLLEVQNLPVGSIAYCVSFDLDSGFERPLQHGQNGVRLLGEESGGIVVVVWLQQRSAFRAEGAVDHDFDSAKGESVIARAEYRARIY